MKNCPRKGCQMFTVQVQDIYYNKRKPPLVEYVILDQYKDVFPEEIAILPPKTNIDFTIDLMPGVVPMLKVPHT